MAEWFLNQICGNDLLGPIIEALKMNLFSNAKFGEVLDRILEIHDDIIKPFAVMLLFIYFMIAVVEKLSSENFTWEELWKQMAMLIVAKFFIDHGIEILQNLFQLGRALLQSIDHDAPKALKQDFEPIVEAFCEGLGLTGILEVLGELILVIILIIPWVASWIMHLAVYIICYSRMIEIYARATFAPIALSDFFHSGIHGGGWRFLKSFFATCLQGALIVVIGVIYSGLFEVVIANMDWGELLLLTALGKIIAFYAATLMLMFKSQSLAKELVGVN